MASNSGEGGEAGPGSSAAKDGQGFDGNGFTEIRSYSELSKQHQRFSKAHAAARSGAPNTGDGKMTIQSFVDAAKESGSYISKEDERRAAQSILDFWSAELINSSSVDTKDWSPAVLKPYTGDNDHFQDPEAQDISPEIALKRRQARELIRLSAVVRRWRDSGESSDYLLSGTALDQAEEHMDLDPGIKALVLKSRSLERRKTKNRWIGFTVVIVVLSFLSVALSILWQLAETERKRAEEQTALANQKIIIAEQQKKMAEEQRKLAESQKIKADDLRELAVEKSIETSEAFELSQTRVRELENAQTQLDIAIRVIANAIKSGAISHDAVPGPILTTLENAVSSSFEFPLNDNPYMTGYNSDFLGVPLRRPTLSDNREATAFLGGGSLHYVNYSLTFDEEARNAIFTASNLDRTQLLVLPRATGKILRDPRIPDYLQPVLPEHGDRTAPENALLVGGEIAWGPFFEGGEFAASEKLASVTKVFPNIIPREAALDRQTWLELDRWILTKHNRSANKVNIFAGSVPGDDDSMVAGIRIPSQYWKIAVSKEPLTRISERLDSLRVDAFLIKTGQRQNTGGTVNPRGESVFDPQKYRVRISDIEKLTGLKFDDRIREADEFELQAAQDPEPPAQVLAENIDLLNLEQETAGATITQNIVNAFGTKGIAYDDQEKIAAALLQQLTKLEASELTTTGLYNYSLILSRIPYQTWDLDSWKPLKTQALNITRKLENLGRRGEIHIAPKSRENLNELKGNLGAETTGLETIRFQFAGMDRNTAVDISFALQELGWDIPGEERTGDARGLNEVRYGPDTDKEIAEILSEDLKTLWTGPGCCKTVQDKTIDPGSLRIRISE